MAGDRDSGHGGGADPPKSQGDSTTRIRRVATETEVEAAGLSIPTPYSEDFLRELARHRPGLDLLDEILRSEHPPYIRERIRHLLEPYPERTGWTVLDYGAGAGASAVTLARLGIPRVIGIDLVNDYASLWRRRLEEAGHPGVGTFVQAGDTRRLPFRDGVFDAAFLNGLIEHLLPEERVEILHEALRVIAPGGFVFLTETPNRLFPRNSHTKLWFSELLPLGWAARLAARFGPRSDFPTRGRTVIYRTGIRGFSVGRLRRIIGARAEVLPPDPELARMELVLARNPLQESPARMRFGRHLWPILKGIARLFRTPVGFLAPNLNLVLRKASHPGSSPTARSTNDSR